MERKYGEGVWGMIKDPAPVVMTAKGAVRGENKQGVAVFHGIPYGDNCDGEYRFLPPRPAKAWEDVKDCTKNAPVAAQFGSSIVISSPLGDYFSGGHPENFGTENETQSASDCLTVNVLTPQLPDDSNDNVYPKKPVLVYFHGGGFTTGTGTLVLGADQWVREEDFVLVGVNHRLGVLGYLYLGDFDEKYAESGTVGMLDLVLALEWVRDNIAVFGGDPEQVTIMGESGGCMKVNNLMAMEKAKGLFHRAIGVSGSNPVGTLSKEQGTASALNLLKSLGLDRNQWQQLLTLPAEDLIKASMVGGLMGFSPVADDINLPYNPKGEYIAPEISKDIPLLVGSSEDELAVFCYEQAKNVTWESLSEVLQAGGGGMMAMPPMSPEKAEEVIRVYKEKDKIEADAPHLYLRIASFASGLGGGAWYQAAAKANQGGAPVYHYVAGCQIPLPGNAEGRKFAWHTADLPLQMRIVRYPEQEWLSRNMAHAWAAFIRTGSPSTAELEWKAFETDNPQVMVFGNSPEETGCQLDPYKEMREILGGE